MYGGFTARRNRAERNRPVPQPTKAQQTAIDTNRTRLFDLEKTLEVIEQGKIAAGGILQAIRDEQLFAFDPDRSYASFEQYTELRWGFGKREADRKIDAFNQVRALRDAGVPEADLPQNPWQARDLAVLVNKTDTATAATTWLKALTDSKDPAINPAQRLTGVFLKGYVDQALATAGAARRQGTSRARAGSATVNTNGTVKVAQHTRRKAGSNGAVAPPPSSSAVPPVQAGVQATSTTGHGVTTPVEINCEVLFELADDVKTKRLHLSNPLSRKPLFEGLAELLDQITAALVPGAVQSLEGATLHAAAETLTAALS